MTAFTSLTHPLRIDTVAPGNGLGRIGLSFCPGKQQRGGWSGDWARDLDLDLDAVRAWGAAAVVTLVEPHELTALGVERMSEAVAARAMRWFHLPIRDVTAPGATFEAAWTKDGTAIRALLRGGQDVFVHCKGGLGRAGTIAARLLVELGAASPAQAIERVRAARAGTIEVGEQEEHIHGCRRVAD